MNIGSEACHRSSAVHRQYSKLSRTPDQILLAGFYQACKLQVTWSPDKSSSIPSWNCHILVQGLRMRGP